MYVMSENRGTEGSPVIKPSENSENEGSEIHALTQ